MLLDRVRGNFITLGLGAAITVQERVPDILDPPNPPLIWGACLSPKLLKSLHSGFLYRHPQQRE
jgi:hypothetical protein